MATCSIFANPIIDTEEGLQALADAYDRFLEEEAKRPPATAEQLGIDPEKRALYEKVLRRLREKKA